MTAVRGTGLTEAGIDAVALKPSEMDLSRASDLAVDAMTVDYEGHEHVPDPAQLRRLADEFELRMTIPVRADGFDPLGNDSVRRSLPDGVGEVLVAGHPAYLSEAEQCRAIAPRLEAAQSGNGDTWVGTEGIERLALAVGGTQFDLLSETSTRDARALRAAGFDEDLAVYAPTVMTTDDDAILDAVGAYAARRQRVAEALPAAAPRDSSIRGSARETLLDACREYALVGTVEDIAARVGRLEDAGVDHVVSYPARGLDAIRT